ncbi:hypothetical protein [Puniceicoccus vermicola]|uniref:Uncharacterized protein n=1 Tax=Puniceicoccus vermicola TaxID=388746 RepID=A0A7X1AW53_9BACT|nr:hypothetical protein [Puniceicoccus vermicola]MBC2601047.1 hypothetical protein [Puniceicoccus vermicola]
MPEELFIHQSGACLLGEKGQTLAELKEGVSRSARRRMTANALMIHYALKDMDLSSFRTVVYQTEYSELRTLEQYVDGFPEPSPLKFQASIHPSGVEQVFIAAQCPIERFFPLADSSAPLAGIQCLDIAGGEGLVIFAEESGTWLLEIGLASSVSFAAALSLSRSEENAIGRLEWEKDSIALPGEDLGSFTRAVQERRPWHSQQSEARLSLEWR